MRSWTYNCFGVLMGTSWRASGPRWPSLRADSLPMITLFHSQGDFYATASLQVFEATQCIPGTSYYVRAQPEALNQYDIIVKRSGDRSNTPAGNATRDFIEDFRPEFILLVGIAGGMQGRDGTALGDIVVSDFTAY